MEYVEFSTVVLFILFILFFIFLKKCYCYSITVVCLFSPSLHPIPVYSCFRVHKTSKFISYLSKCSKWKDNLGLVRNKYLALKHWWCVP